MSTADQVKRLNDMLNKRKGTPAGEEDRMTSVVPPHLRKVRDEVPEDEDFEAEGIDERERISRFMKVIQKQEAALAKALEKAGREDD